MNKDDVLRLAGEPVAAWSGEYDHDGNAIEVNTSAPTKPKIAECRDAILNGRGPLEAVLDGDQTNAVLAVFDAYLVATPAGEIQPASIFNPTRHEPVPLSEWRQMEAALTAANERIRLLSDDVRNDLEVNANLCKQVRELEAQQIAANKLCIQRINEERAISDKLVDELHWQKGYHTPYGQEGPVTSYTRICAALAEVAAMRQELNKRTAV